MNIDGIRPTWREVEALKAENANLHAEIDTLRSRLAEAEGLMGDIRANLPGWREIVAEWDDHAKDPALATAMYIILDQMDDARKRLADFLAGKVKEG